MSHVELSSYSNRNNEELGMFYTDQSQTGKPAWMHSSMMFRIPLCELMVETCLCVYVLIS